MYGRISISANLLIIFILLYLLKVLLRRDKFSILNHEFYTKPYIAIVAPGILILINLVINIVFRPTLIYWIFGFTPIIIPILFYLIDYISYNKLKRLYKDYEIEIKNFIGEKLSTLNVSENNRVIKIYLDYNYKKIYCKINIKLDADYLVPINVKRLLEDDIKKVYKDIKFNISVENKKMLIE